MSNHNKVVNYIIIISKAQYKSILQEMLIIDSIYMLEFFLQNSKVCKARYEKTKNQEFRNFNILVVVCIVACVQICEDTSEQKTELNYVI